MFLNRDMDENLVTVTSRMDMRNAIKVATTKAITEAALEIERSKKEGASHGPSLPKPPMSVPSVTLELVSVKAVSDCIFSFILFTIATICCNAKRYVTASLSGAAKY